MKSHSPLELIWQFQAPKVRGFFRHKFLSFMKCFQIFINVTLPIFKKKILGLRNYVFWPKNAFTLWHIAMNTLYTQYTSYKRSLWDKNCIKYQSPMVWFASRIGKTALENLMSNLFYLWIQSIYFLLQRSQSYSVC